MAKGHNHNKQIIAKAEEQYQQKVLVAPHPYEYTIIDHCTAKEAFNFSPYIATIK
jgi:hypothetical protein